MVSPRAQCLHARVCITERTNTQEFNRRFPGTRTLHAFPRSVATTNKTHPSLPWIYRAVGWVATWFAQAPADYADVAMWETASEE